MIHKSNSSILTGGHLFKNVKQHFRKLLSPRIELDGFVLPHSETGHFLEDAFLAKVFEAVDLEVGHPKLLEDFGVLGDFLQEKWETFTPSSKHKNMF